MRFLQKQFETPLLQPGDNLWFFFAGHGRRYQDKDYLMLPDSDPSNVGETAVSVDYVTERLRRSGADNVVLLLDACRDAEIERLNKKYQTDWFSCEKPQREVTVPPSFMGKYPVTQAQWRAIASLPKIERELKPKPSNFKGDDRPVESVSWHDAVEFCKRLSASTGRYYRLPSEAEWEYACRAISGSPLFEGGVRGGSTPFYFGETITDKLANYDANYDASYTYADEPKGEYRKETTPVGQFPPNAFGLYDMHGNVWEWCADHWHDNYDGAPEDGSAWLSENKNYYRLLRGGSWLVAPPICRSAVRSYYRPDNGNYYIGLRVVAPSRT
jgi:formylglycine-generating enzyme required for sulfatase activity